MILLNIFKIKKWGAFFLMAFVPTLTFYLTLVNYRDFIYAVIFFMVATLGMTVIASKLISHPLLELIEGKGIIAFTFDSTGIIQPFICRVIPPFTKGRLGKQEITDVWDREAVFYLTRPKKGQLTVARDEDGELYEVIVLGKAGEKHVDELFGFEGLPALIYNRALNTFITKSALAELESSSIVRHVIFYLNKRVEELTAMIRDFARYVVEQTKPKKGLFGLGNWFWIILLIAIVVIVMLFVPAFMDTFSNLVSSNIPVTPVQPTPQAPVVPKT